MQYSFIAICKCSDTQSWLDKGMIIVKKMEYPTNSP